jgi:hypothetical protein
MSSFPLPPRFLTDADFNLHIVAGLRRRQPSIDLATAHDLNLRTLLDPQLLEMARGMDRILLTHDRKTMPRHFRNYVAGLPAGQHSPGVIWIHQNLPVATAIDAILLIWECSTYEEWHDQFTYLPI